MSINYKESMQGAKKKARQIYYQHNNQIKGENISHPQKKNKIKKFEKKNHETTIIIRERKQIFKFKKGIGAILYACLIILYNQRSIPC